MADITKKIYYWQKRYNIKPILEIQQVEKGHSIAYFSNEQKVLLELDEEALLNDLPEIFASIKLGEKNPLLTTFFFQENLTQEDKEFCSMFYTLCEPLKDAWTWKEMKKYLTKEEMDKQLEELKKLYEIFLEIEQKIKQGEKSKEAIQRRGIIGTYLIFSSLGYPVKIQLTGENKKEWKKYLKALKHFSLSDPDPQLFCQLPEITKAPYRAEVKEKPYWHFYITKQET